MLKNQYLQKISLRWDTIQHTYSSLKKSQTKNSNILIKKNLKKLQS